MVGDWYRLVRYLTSNGYQQHVVSIQAGRRVKPLRPACITPLRADLRRVYTVQLHTVQLYTMHHIIICMHSM